MIPGVRGRLVTASFARDLLPGVPGAAPMPAPAARALQACWRRCGAALGPAAGVRAVADVALLPMLGTLGYETTPGPIVQSFAPIVDAFLGPSYVEPSLRTAYPAAVPPTWLP